MKKTPTGTPVGVDDPYDHAELCDHLTGEGTCRYAFEHPQHDREFAMARREEEFACPVVSDESGEDWTWADCPHFRATATDRECARCGLEEKRMAHDSTDRPLLEEHHLSYASEDRETSHEITVYLCRWCHAKVHNSWARVTDDASPDPEAIAALEERRGREMDEFGFQTANERFQDGGGRQDG
ncbi:DUF7097 family protein [Haloarchaeobius sp. TZWSO28]|uniref:DUF7097 family protein n=1 Tax=Haloarchaeobius sp. TZWSO28 TaxID=3446119 RepID=UPI003EBAAB56